ncbi:MULTISPECIES: BCCT family transporter [unclassified Corynebacterium]|uniref:BCCT family transporter n=1 Tax=unclassified Corynebacterium TaxID=2624378 RepID=UPI0034CFD8AA
MSSDRSKRFLGLKTDPFVFLVAAGFIVVFVAGTLLFGARARDLYAVASNSLLTNLGWLYIGGFSIIFVFLIGIFVSRYGNLRLGDDDDEPEYSLPVWFSMLFAAGLGATLLFWGAAEPLHHSFNPPRGGLEPMSQEAIDRGFHFTYYHFAVHMWVPFALPGLAMGYFVYKRKMPARMSSVFSPLLGKRVYRWPGKLIDALSIIGTVFGLAVSVGLGVLQINAGLNIMFDVPLVGWVEVLIIVVVTAIASISVASGLDRGVKILSNVNIVAAFVLMLFVLVMGPTLTLLKHTVEAFGGYASSLPELMFWTDSFEENPGWQGTWTAFYWAWTICWAPFVGMFIARISRGRTVRQFIGGVLALPTIVVVVWFSIFGRAAIETELGNPGILTKPVVEDGDTPVALFALLEQYPLYMLSGTLALAVIIVFFITSMDSAALVMDTFASGEENKTPTYYRVSWACAVGLVTAALLFINDTGIEAIQEVVIVVALPFFLMEFVMMYSLVKGMNDDSAAQRRTRTRHWSKTDTPEKYEAADARPAPGYDSEGNELDRPELEYDEEGNMRIPGNIIVEGDLGVGGDFDDDWDGDSPAGSGDRPRA